MLDDLDGSDEIELTEGSVVRNRSVEIDAVEAQGCVGLCRVAIGRFCRPAGCSESSRESAGSTTEIDGFAAAERARQKLVESVMQTGIGSLRQYHGWR